MSRKTLAACSALLLLVCTPAPAEVYRWVDDDGQVHYAGTRPLGESAERVQLRSNEGNEDAARQADEQFQAARAASAKRRADDAEAAAAEAAKAERCEKAREVVRYFENRIPNRVFVTAEDGSTARMTEEQHAAELATARKNAAAHCS